jgi:hypothetical protein
VVFIMAGSALHLIIADDVRRRVLVGRADTGAAWTYPEEYLLGSLGADIWYAPSLDAKLPDSPFPLSFADLFDAIGGPDSPLTGLRRVLGEIEAARDSHDLGRALKVLAGAPVILGHLAGRRPAFSDLLFQALPVFVAYEQQDSSLADVDNWTEQKWGFGDLLHWRRTGRFLANLWAVAEERSGEPGERAKAFALGYLTHIATDVTSHAYVNQIVGGPARALREVAPSQPRERQRSCGARAG